MSPLFVNEFKVSALDLKPWSDDRFALNYATPGTFVNDGTLPGVQGKTGVVYQIPADPGRLDDAVQEAQAKYQMRLSKVNNRRLRTSTLLIVLNAVILLGVLVYLGIRRRRAQKA